MQRRRSDPEQRRRLLLLEEAARQEHAADSRDETAAPREAARRPALYPQEAQRDGMVRVADLIPRRNWVLALAWLLGAGVIALLEWLYALMPRVASLTTDGRVAALDLDGEGSLAVWYSSTLLLLAAGLSWFIYTIRRHRLDDYKARYRFWLLACGVWLLMSIDETGSLHEGFKEMMSYATGTRIAGDGSLWWVAAYLLVLFPVGVFLLRELAEFPVALAALLLTGLCYAVAVAAQLQWIWPQSGARGVMLEEGAEMAGHLFLVFALLLYARGWLRQLENPAQAAATSGRRLGQKRKRAGSLPASGEADSPKPSKRRGEKAAATQAEEPQPTGASASEKPALPETATPEKPATADAAPGKPAMADAAPGTRSRQAPEEEPESHEQTSAGEAAGQQQAKPAELQLLGQSVVTAPATRKKKKRKKKKKR